jgi:hypothetical protein
MMFVLTSKSKIPGRRSGVYRCAAVNSGKSNTCLHDERWFCRTFACLLSQDFRILRFARLIVLISKDLKKKISCKFNSVDQKTTAETHAGTATTPWKKNRII